jgi:hypothetical protein
VCIYLNVLDEGTLGHPAGIPVILGYLPYSPQQVWVNFVVSVSSHKGLLASQERTPHALRICKVENCQITGVLVTVGARMSSLFSGKRFSEIGTVVRVKEIVWVCPSYWAVVVLACSSGFSSVRYWYCRVDTCAETNVGSARSILGHVQIHEHLYMHLKCFAAMCLYVNAPYRIFAVFHYIC